MTDLDPATTALVLIDLQNRFMDVPLAPYPGREVLGRCMRLAMAARAAGAIVVLVSVEWGTHDAPPSSVDVPPHAFEEATNPEWSSLVSGLAQPGDLRIPKRHWGAFYGTELELQLRRRGIRTLILAGLATNYGVESTARQAWELGFDQIVVSDAMSTISTEAHEFALTHVFARIAKVLPTADVGFVVAQVA